MVGGGCCYRRKVGWQGWQTQMRVNGKRGRSVVANFDVESQFCGLDIGIISKDLHSKQT